MRKAISVKTLNKYIKTILSNDPILKNVYVEGEITNFKHSTYTYFDLIEDNEIISCVSFSSRYKDYKNGMRVVVSGYISTFNRASKYQIIVNNIEEDGLGDKLIKLKELKEKLQKEGLFDEDRKKSLPKFPMNIGAISSFKGAAIKDFLKILNRRYPIGEVHLYDTSVQGINAEKEIYDALSYMDNKYDVICLLRGGGSNEDLSVFNSEILVRKISQMNTPVVTAIGHQVDTTLVDFVSDLRAITPTEAAELIGPDIYQIQDMIDVRHSHQKVNINSDIINNKKWIKEIEKLDLLEKYKFRVEKIKNSNDRFYLSLLKNIEGLKSTINSEKEKSEKLFDQDIKLFNLEGKQILNSKDINISKEYILDFNKDKYIVRVVSKYE